MMQYSSSGAIISDNKLYRYKLWREWTTGFLQPLKTGTVVFIMLNPSTADGQQDDPTIRRCVNYTNDWGYGRVEIVNLFAYRSTDPRELLKVEDPVGPENNDYLKKAAYGAALIVCGWGSMGWIDDRAKRTKKMLQPFKHKTYCFGTTQGNHPKHPLYLSKDTQLELMK